MGQAASRSSSSGWHEKKTPGARPIQQRERSAGVDTDGGADTQKVDVTSHDEQWVRWHVLNDTPEILDVQVRVQDSGS
ncbi:hypothetical protein Pth03_29570 [Planotetraspora thailandica]|uniref:Uncharacterized protein n=1 Tax=Planotetraspora thailandica TaxID=487172 RepID=A0A8J3UZ75_9ACTN|nr:hypothetical protein Pth03_29570 [Planotetraspora thailandica]